MFQCAGCGEELNLANNKIRKASLNGGTIEIVRQLLCIAARSSKGRPVIDGRTAIFYGPKKLEQCETEFAPPLAQSLLRPFFASPL